MYAIRSYYDTIVAQSCRRVLEAEGIMTKHASTVKISEAMLEAETFGLLLTDIKMSGEDGFAMIARAKEIYPEIPVLIMTGYLIPDIIDRGRSQGVTNFIAKPFTPEELVEAVQKLK